LSGDDLVLWRREERVGVMTLNRPDRLNAWTPELGRCYAAHLDSAIRDPQVSAIVITGAGRGFCAGAELAILGGTGPIANPWGAPDPPHFLRSVPKPVIAAINGPCAGIGLVVALMCDVRFAARDTKITTAFARRGLSAEFGSAWILARIVGVSRALDLLLSGRTLLGDEAAAMGLVDHVAAGDEVLASALAYAHELSRNCSPWSMATIKRQMNAALDSDFAAAAREAEALMLESFERPDLAEGVRSFEARRPPNFPPLSP
jgi:enoyl-CoA hydratase/carnithine racemase